jgi:hypothetical protein
LIVQATSGPEKSGYDECQSKEYGWPPAIVEIVYPAADKDEPQAPAKQAAEPNFSFIGGSIHHHQKYMHEGTGYMKEGQ